MGGTHCQSDAFILDLAKKCNSLLAVWSYSINFPSILHPVSPSWVINKERWPVSAPFGPMLLRLSHWIWRKLFISWWISCILSLVNTSLFHHFRVGSGVNIAAESYLAQWVYVGAWCAWILWLRISSFIYIVMNEVISDVDFVGQHLERKCKCRAL